jgi:hypothetical protein
MSRAALGGRRRHWHRPLRISEVLRRLADHLPEERVTLGHIADRLGAHAFGFLILVVSLPMILPNLPGVSTVFGAVVIVLALQIALGRRRMRLPRRLRRLTIGRAMLRTMVARSVPWIERAERVIRPRGRVMTHGTPLNLAGALMVVLGIVMALPIPFGNGPTAIACVLFAIGLLGRDGVFVALGWIVGLASLAIAGSVIYGFVFVAETVVGG